MAQSRRRPTRPPANAVEALYANHAAESAGERDAALTDAAREAHDRAWAAHFTAVNTTRQAARLRARAERLRSDAGWHARQRPDRRQWVVHPRTKVRVLAADYLTEVAGEHDQAAVAAVARAAEWHARGTAHSIAGRKADADYADAERAAVAEKADAKHAAATDKADAAHVAATDKADATHVAATDKADAERGTRRQTQS